MLPERFDRMNPQPTDLVFPSPVRMPINDRRFRERAWKTVLESGMTDYQTPYQVRHAAIGLLQVDT
jgi:integrase